MYTRSTDVIKQTQKTKPLNKRENEEACGWGQKIRSPFLFVAGRLSWLHGCPHVWPSICQVLQRMELKLDELREVPAQVSNLQRSAGVRIPSPDQLIKQAMKQANIASTSKKQAQQSHHMHGSITMGFRPRLWLFFLLLSWSSDGSPIQATNVVERDCLFPMPSAHTQQAVLSLFKICLFLNKGRIFSQPKKT